MFEYEGSQFTEQELKIEADKQGLGFGDFVQRMKKRGMTQAGSSPAMSMGSDTLGAPLTGGSMEQQKESAASNWFGDAWFAGEINADMYDDADNVFDIGNAEDARELTTEELNTYIGLLEKSKVAAGEMKEAQRFAEAYGKYEAQGENMIMSTIMGVGEVGIKGFAQNMVQSMRGQFNLQQVGESAAAAATTYTTAQLAGIAAGSIGGPVGTFIGAVAGAIGGVAGGTAAAFAAANYGMETIHMFNQLLEEEVKNAGLEFTPESIRKIMSDDGIRSRIKSKARSRGGTIAAVEGVTSLIGIKGGAAIARSGMRTTSLVGKTGKYLGVGAVNTTAEIVGGGGGEYLGAKAAGMEATGLDIVNEAFSGVATTAPISTVVSGISALANKPGYFVEGKKVTKRSLLDYTDRAQTPQELAQLNFQVKNDPLLEADLQQKQLRASIDVQIDPLITNIDQRNKLIDLQIEKTKLEGNKKKQGAFKLLNNDKKLEKVDQDIDNILSGLESVETTGVKEQLEKGVQQYSIQKTIQLLENEAGPIPNMKEAFAVEDDNAAQAAYEKVRAEFGLEEKDVTGADGFIVPTPEGNVVVINKDIAGKKGQINVGGHELLHAVVQKHYTSLGDGSVAQKEFIDDFKNTISKKSLKYIQDIIDGRNANGENITPYSDEYLTIYSDGIVKKQIGYDESVGVKLKNFIQNTVRKVYKAAGVDYGKEFGSGLDTYNFMRDYNKSIMDFNKLSDRAKAVAGVKAVGSEVKKSVSKDQTDSVNELAEMGWTDKTWKESGADFAIKEMQSNKMLDGLIRSKYKADIVPDNFVDLVYSELVSHVKNFKPEQNDNLFGWINSQIANKAGNVYNREFKVADEMKGAKDIGKTTKEGEVKVQVAAEKSSELEAFEEEDLSIQGQAKKAKADKQKYSEYRRKLGFKEGDKIYNEVLENVKKSLMIAYGTTQNIADVQLRAQAIAAKLKKEYANLNSPLFKQIKNFLTYGVADTKVPYGTKDIYISQLKKLREDIVKNTSTADLVQMERNTPEADRVFTDFVKVLTSVEQVQDAVNKEQLPPDALNKITKDKKTGKGAFSPSLYNKVMPTETELVSWADQPGKNPITGLRQGLKGTRKDGLAMRMVNSLVTDAIMEARQSDQVQDRIAGMEIDPGSVAELGAAIGREVNVKFSKSNAIGDITAAMDGSGSVNVYSQIKFSKSHREAYEKQLTKRRPDLTEKQRKNAVQSVFDFVDDKAIPNHKKSKYEKMAMHYTASGYLILPEDGYKVIEAEKIATQKKLDPLSFKNPNVLIETFVGEVKGTRTNPDNVKTFSNKTELAGGVTVYNVEDSKQGQLDTRKVIDTHFGKESNPWCLAARKNVPTPKSKTHKSKDVAKKFEDKLWEEGQGYQRVNNPDGTATTNWDVNEGEVSLDDAFGLWKDYNKEGNGHQIAFQNGRLVAFRDGNKDPQWWDRNDKATSGVVVRGKKGKDGFKPVIEVGKTKETILYYEKVTGDKKNGTTIEKDLDGSLISQVTKKNGRLDGEIIRVDKKNKKSNEYYRTQTENYKDGSRVDYKEERTYIDKKAVIGTRVGRSEEVRLDNITKYERSFTERDGLLDTETINIEGTVNQKYFKEFNDPTSPSMTGFEKTNLPNLTPAYERYYGVQGQKVTVKQELTDKGLWKDKGSKVTIDGVVQEPRVKFSKSAENSVKFSLTSKQQDRNVLPAILKKQLDVERIITKEGATESDLILLEYLNEFETAITSGLNYEEAYNSFINNVPEAAKTSLVNFKDIQSFEKSVVDTQVPQIRSLGLDAAGVYFKNKFNKLTTTKDKVDLINKFLTNIGISARGGKGLVKSYTNQQLLEGPVTKIFGKKFVEKHFNLTEVKKGKTIKYRYDNKAYEPVPLYKDVDIIKESRGETSIVKEVNNEAVQARAFVQEIIDSNISVSEKLAIIDLLSLNQRGAIRKMYTFGETVTSKVKKPATELVLEHEITVKNMTKYLRQRVKDILNQTQLEEIMDQAKVHVWNNNIDTILNDQGLRQEGGRKRYQNKKVKNYLQTQKDKGLITDIPSTIKPVNNLPKAVQFSRSANNPIKGITVLDFDDTLATSKSLVKFTRPDGTKGTLNAEQYASTYESLSDLGYKFDFSEFTKVVDGKTAPLFNKAMKLQGKFGPESMFVLTARPAESAGAIHAFLKANGLNIPLKNITGLANSTAEAKALWMAGKVGEGFNDFYFADDALQNVKAVKNMLNQLDVKSKVQQAKVKFSKSMNEKFNDILENTTGIDSVKRFSEIKGRKRGDDKGKFRLFIPPSHEDFVGLLYNFMGKGKEGNKHRDFFEQALVRPINRAYREIDTAKQAIANDYKALNKKFPEIKDKLIKTTPDGDFTFSDAIRVYLWNKHGHKIPGLTEADQAQLTELVQSDPQLQAYAETLNIISKQETYVAPGQSWEMGNIRIDLVDATGRVGRAEYFSEFQENAEIIFSEENLNKIEAGYGKDFREALEDMLHRIKTGVNRPKGASAKPNAFMNWLNASVAGVMFFNTRSALLQQMSNVNYLNFADNNIFKAGLAFANQPQYWKDFAMIFNSDMLKQRRGGLGTDINGAELAEAIKKARPDSVFDQVAIITGKALKLGFLPTQIGDNIAIATGGAAFYRNRVNKYVKDGMSIKEAENAAFTDFQNITQSTQQSARPDMTSQQQASWIGKLVLNFLNTPSQYNRIIKKAGLDIKNRRITGPNTSQTQSDMSNMSRILYYGAAQNLIFYSLQTALFAVMFGTDDDEDDKRAEQFLKKKERVINGSIDTILRGSGIYGVAISTLKNMAIKFMEQREKGYNKDESAVLMEGLNFSPVLGIKARRIVNAEKTINYNVGVINEMETFDLDNPQWSAVTNYTQSITGAPLNKMYQKVINLRNAADNDYTALQRALFLSGYTTWSLNLGDTKKMEGIKQDVKDKKKIEADKKRKDKKKKNVKPYKIKKYKIK